MATTRSIPALLAAGMLAAGLSAATAWADEPDDNTNDTAQDGYVAVGSGTFRDSLSGYQAAGATREEAAANVIAACQADGGQDCTSDAETNDNVCIVSVADDETDRVAGGGGVTVEDAQQDALRRAAENGTPFGPDAVVVISDCPPAG